MVARKGYNQRVRENPAFYFECENILKYTTELSYHQLLSVSYKELHVWYLISQGYSDPEILDRIQVSAGTVKNQLGTLYTKILPLWNGNMRVRAARLFIKYIEQPYTSLFQHK